MRVIASLAAITFLLLVPGAEAAENPSQLERLTQTAAALTVPVSSAIESVPPAVSRPGPAAPDTSVAPSPAKAPPASIEAPLRSGVPPPPTERAAEPSAASAVPDEAAERLGTSATAVAAAAGEVVRPRAPTTGARVRRQGAGLPGQPNRAFVGVSRPAPPPTLLAYIWPAIALDRGQVASIVSSLGAPVTALLAGAALSASSEAGEGSEAVPRTPAPTVAESPSPRSPASLPLNPLLGSSSPLPIVIFYVALVAALVAIWVSWRRELGLRIGPRL